MPGGHCRLPVIPAWKGGDRIPGESGLAHKLGSTEGDSGHQLQPRHACVYVCRTLTAQADVHAHLCILRHKEWKKNIVIVALKPLKVLTLGRMT